MSMAGQAKANETVVERVIDATPERVWEAFTDPAQIAKWWGPEGFTTTTQKMDLRPGGQWLHTMIGPDGRKYEDKVTYKEVVRPEKLVYSFAASEEQGLLGFDVSATFEDLGGKTRVTLRASFASEEERAKQIKEVGALDGGHQTLARLGAFLGMPSAGRVIAIERIIDAPRERVWKAWVEPAQLMRWFHASDGWHTPSADVDVRPGGEFHIGFRSPDGAQGFDFAGTYAEVAPPERLVMVIGDGRPVTVTFEDLGGKTRLTIGLTLESVNGEAQQREGWTAMLVNLGVHLVGRTTLFAARGGKEVVMSRVFAASRERLWNAMTDPEAVPKWWGPAALKTAVEKMDFRVGGGWRFTQRAPDGSEFAFFGTYREIVPMEKIVETFEFEPMAGHVVVNTMTLEDVDGGTRMTVLSTYASREDRDGMVQAGMETGQREGWERLAAFAERHA